MSIISLRLCITSQVHQRICLRLWYPPELGLRTIFELSLAIVIYIDMEIKAILVVLVVLSSVRD